LDGGVLCTGKKQSPFLSCLVIYSSITYIITMPSLSGVVTART
jgi:hypothetical protein